MADGTAGLLSINKFVFVHKLQITLVKGDNNGKSRRAFIMPLLIKLTSFNVAQYNMLSLFVMGSNQISIEKCCF